MRRPSRSLTQLLEDQVRRWRAENEQRPHPPAVPPPLITLSRQPGAGGLAVAQALAAQLDLDVFDRELIERVACSAHMSTAVVESLDERGRSSLEEWVLELMHSEHLWADDYLHHLFKVIGVIARHGRAVIVGRGASFVLPPGPRLAVRLLAPEADRVRRTMTTRGMDDNEAHVWVRRTEAERIAFIRRYFGADATDPKHYDLTLNTGRLGLTVTTEVIAAAARTRIEEARATTGTA
jgi:cytidylate kinase